MHKEICPYPSEEEVAILRDIANKQLRVVHSQRKRKLRRNGIRCWYFPFLGVYLWRKCNG